MRAGWSIPRRVVVKIGSAVITKAGAIDPSAVARIVADVRAVLDAPPGVAVVIVSSGAVASGFRALGLDRPPKDIMGKQAAAAVGQPVLMDAYADAFRAAPGRPRAVAQVLLTADDLDHRARFLNARNTLDTLLRAGVVPIINENDSVSFEEIKLGDNDHLGAMVASLVDADLLLILSSVAGVWDIDAPAPRTGPKPRAPVIVPEIRSLAEALRHVQPDKTDTGVGGMATKVRAACTAAALGVRAVIAHGAEVDVVRRIVQGEPLGTLFPPASAARAAAARKKWIGFSARPQGTIVVDDGARRAVEQRGASLLPGGVREVHGEFDIGALVELQDLHRHAFARGIASYSAREVTAIAGKRSADIPTLLGYTYRDEVVHRDQLVLLESAGIGAPPLVRRRSRATSKDRAR